MKKVEHLFMAISLFLREHNMNFAVLIKVHMFTIFLARLSRLYQPDNSFSNFPAKKRSICPQIG